VYQWPLVSIVSFDSREKRLHHALPDLKPVFKVGIFHGIGVVIASFLS